MIPNPFLSKTFTSVWSKHFNGNKPGSNFSFLNGPSFFKPSSLPFYINLGKNLTKGISYSSADTAGGDYKGKTILLYDIPQFFDINTENHPKELKTYRIKQYPGFLINLDSYTDLNNYMTATFSKSSRYKLNKYKKRLEASFDISYKMLLGDIAKEEYDLVFEHFKNLLQKRFQDKQITNNNLDPKEWEFYREVAYPMILEKQACLFVIYEREIPIGVTLCYLSEDILFDAITVFDIDYSKFHLGSVTIMKLIEWCLENKLKVLDFSKGYFDYKTRWANKSYDFEYHIWYDSKSLTASIIAFSLKTFFTLKQKLREKEINTKLHKLRFLLKNSKKEASEEPIMNYQFSESTQSLDLAQLKKISLDEESNAHLKPMVFDFLYLNSEILNEVALYKIDDTSNSYLISGKKLRQEVKIG